MQLDMDQDEGRRLAELFHRTFRQRKVKALSEGGDYTQQDFANDLGMNYKTVNRILGARELYTEQLATLKALSRLIGRDAVLNAVGWVENPTKEEQAAVLGDLFDFSRDGTDLLEGEKEVRETT